MNMDGVRKDASVGEYDPRSGLTHVTRQRGRLLFNMGASLRKQRAAPGLAPGLQVAEKPPPPPPPRAAASIASSIAERLVTGPFTGLSLFPEEALYLAQRGALAVFLMADNRQPDGARLDRPPLNAAAFQSLLERHQRVPSACLDVYAFLKGEKLHPRRCLSTSHGGDQAEGQRRAPLLLPAGDHSPSSAAFDVWKAVAAPSLPDATAAPSPSESEPSAKRLQLVFRVLVSRFDDPPPSPRRLRRAVLASHAEQPHVPVKLAVVGRDRSVLLLALAAP